MIKLQQHYRQFHQNHTLPGAAFGFNNLFYNTFYVNILHYIKLKLVMLCRGLPEVKFG